MSKKFTRFMNLYINPVVDLIVGLIGWLLIAVFGFAFVLGLLALIVSVDAFVLTSLWPIVIPKIFPGLVAQGYLVGSVDFSTMFWTLAVLMVLRPANIANIFSKSSKKEKNDDGENNRKQQR